MAATRACMGFCDPGEALTEPQVMTILDQGARELQARGVPGTIAVVDRVGNALAVWSTDGDPVSILISSNRPRAVQVPLTSLQNGFENTLLPGALGAISKAVTGAFLSSQGNAFSTRTANDIIGANFPPGNNGQMSGPLFGVQFSQLPCGDWVRRDDPMLNGGSDAFDNVLDGRAGPKRAPLGFSADPGGFPLYINGVIVGGIGVVARETTMTDSTGKTIAVSIYGVQGRRDAAADLEEQIALSASRGFEAPANRVAGTVAVMGRLLRYTNTEASSRTERATALATQLPTGGQLTAVPGFFDGTQVFRGVRVGMPESGIVPASGSTGGAGFGVDRKQTPIRAQVLVTPDGLPFLGRNSGRVTNPRGSISPPSGVGLTADEVRSIIDRALSVAQEARAQIRQPNGSFVQVNVHVCDRDGNELGYARTPDAPLFGSDVALQKCRAAAFFSRGTPTAPPGAATPTAADLLLREDQMFAMQGQSQVGKKLGIMNGVRNVTMQRYLERVRAFIPRPNALADGIAFSNRAFGLLARPCFPDGVNCVPDQIGGLLNSAAPGPFSVDGDPRKFSPLANGFQLEYAKDAVLDGALGRAMSVPEPTTCGTLSSNGFQIFAGGEPIFKKEMDASGNPTGRMYEVGAIGISGDGIDQDDMVGFLGVDRASRLPNSLVSNAPRNIRADTLQPRVGNDTSLRYVNCPPAPFNSPFEDEQNVCEGR